ncbi:MAG TPA: UPF0182 family protein [Gemmatimonadaceae bacterium]
MPDDRENEPRPPIFRPGAGGEVFGGPPPGGRARGRRPTSFGARPRLLFWLALAVVLLLLVAPTAALRLSDYLWYREIGFERVFLLKIVAQWTLGLLAGLAGFVSIWLGARAALRRLERDPLRMLDRASPRQQARDAILSRMAGIFLVPLCALLAVFAALLAASEWRTLVQFYYRTPFGVADPIMGRDIAWYVFTLPALELALDYTSLVVFLGLAVTGAIFFAGGEIWRQDWRIRVGPVAQLQLAVPAAILLALAGLRAILVGIPALLYGPHGPLHGASYTDIHVRIPALYALGALALAGAAWMIRGAARDRLVASAAVAYGAWIAGSALLFGIVPAAFQRLVVQPNELARETPQIRHHIAATRAAWGIDRVVRRDLQPERRLTARDIEANQATIANVRLWDREPLLQTFGQIQAIRTYYDFVQVDDDRYRIDGELRQVLLSARELNSAALPTRTFINEHLTFTHGMGVTLGPSNQVTGEGLPVLWVKDLPPESSVGVQITRPQLYFGELSNDFVLAPSRQQEFDYPAGEGEEASVYTRYDGDAGVPIGSFARRLLFALRFGSLNILLSRDLTDSTRILYHRDVADRAARALPFLRFDGDPYLVVTDSGHLKWILDAYTSTDRYPYAQPLTDGTNYMRNSVKVVIDAYHGDVTAWLADPADPMIRTLARIYPGMLRPLGEMPADLRAHLRYPEQLFRAQTALYGTFHMTDAETFYHREDQWQIPAGARGDGGESFLRHIVMRLPGEAEPEFILMRPFTPRQKDNLAAWMVARNDGEHYGELVVYRFPRQSLVFGPTQIVNRINQDTEVARQISLWDQRGSEVVRGELLVIPIEESLLYVQPLYLRAQGGRIPELKRVIVAHEGQVAMDSTLELGLVRLFGGGARAPRLEVAGGGTTDAAPRAAGAAGAPSAAVQALLRQAAGHYDRARAAQRADDWATYGEEMRRLGEVLRRLRADTPEAAPPR